MLNEMERARLCGDQECDVVGRNDTFPIKAKCRAIDPDKKNILLTCYVQKLSFPFFSFFSILSFLVTFSL